MNQKYHLVFATLFLAGCGSQSQPAAGTTQAVVGNAPFEYTIVKKKEGGPKEIRG